MSLWTRIGKLFSKPTAPAAPKSMLDLAPGDICEVSLVTYEVTGRTKTSGRNAAVLTLRDGSQVAYLYVEEREELQYRLYHPIDGRLDSPSEVPATLELDDRMFYLEEEYEGYAAVTGQTPYMNGGEQHVWQYQSDDSRLLRVEWQNGRFMLYEGEAVIAADVRVIRGS